MNLYRNIEEYISLSQSERQSHLVLIEPCIEVGGDSQEFRGVLSLYLKTTIPRGMKIHLCHACNNAKCSNPRHLYWGSAGENLKDAFNAGRRAAPSITHFGKMKENGLKNKIHLLSGKGTIWVTNGSINKRVIPDKIPNGFSPGRIWLRSSNGRAPRS